MSIPAEYLGLLVHPVYKTPLQLSQDTDQLSDTVHGELFAIREQVPVLLTGTLHEALATTGRHREEGTSFQYKEHYQQDAVAYDYTEESKDPVEREEIVRLRQTILAQIPSSADWILDVGCGGGWLAKALVPGGRHLISMDISDVNPIRAAKSVPSPHHFGLVADVFELPLKEASMDCIIASEIIEHVSDPGKFISALLQVLKPGGRLIITTPYNEFIRTSLCIHCNRLTPHNAHLHSFTEQSIRQYIPAGVKEVSLKVFNSKLLVKTRVQKLFSFLPLAAWEYIDKAGNAMTGKKAYRLMAIITK